MHAPTLSSALGGGQSLVHSTHLSHFCNLFLASHVWRLQRQMSGFALKYKHPEVGKALLWEYTCTMWKKRFFWFSGCCQIVSLKAQHYTAGACCSSALIKRQGHEKAFSLHLSLAVKVFILKLPRSSRLLKALLSMHLCACWPLNSQRCSKYERSSCVPLTEQSHRHLDSQVARSFGCAQHRRPRKSFS